jgi:hypothetical protein
MMSLRYRSCVILVGLLALSPAVAVSQFCVTESQIPSSTPTSQFTDHADGTVTDNQTSLMWAKCPLGLSGASCAAGSEQWLTWGDALQAGESSDLAGHADWRLPNIKELTSIIELRCGAPAVNSAVFPNTPISNDFWTSSPSAFDATAAWTVLFVFAGDSPSVSSRSDMNLVRLVRSAP